MRYTKELPDRAIFMYSGLRVKDCAWCGNKTRFYEDVGTDAPLCSEECNVNYWTEATRDTISAPRKLT